MTKRFIALYDAIIYAIVSSPAIMNVLYIMLFGKLTDLHWCLQNQKSFLVRSTNLSKVARVVQVILVPFSPSIS